MNASSMNPGTRLLRKRGSRVVYPYRADWDKNRDDLVEITVEQAQLEGLLSTHRRDVSPGTMSIGATAQLQVLQQQNTQLQQSLNSKEADYTEVIQKLQGEIAALQSHLGGSPSVPVMPGPVDVTSETVHDSVHKLPDGVDAASATLDALQSGMDDIGD